MTYKFEKLMAKWEIELDNPVCDPAFVTKVNDFRARLEKKSLTDEEITAWDDELTNLFQTLHELKEEESPEVKKAQRRADMAELKSKITDAETPEQLNALTPELENFPELQPLFDKRTEKLQKAMEKVQKDQFFADAQAEIKETEYNDLAGLLEKYKDYPDLVVLIQSRIEKEKPIVKDKTKRELLSEAKKREWSYEDLKAIGITPTGFDMEIEGVTLTKQYMFKVYHITKVDGKKI